MPYEVEFIRVDPRPIAVVRRRAKVEQLKKVVPEASGEVWQFLRASGVPNSGLNLAVYAACLDKVMDIEIGVIVLHPFEGDGSVICSATPAGLVATVPHIGPYESLGETHKAILARCHAEGRRKAGPFWEIYGHWNDDTSKLRTDIYYLLDDAESPAKPPS